MGPVLYLMEVSTLLWTEVEASRLSKGMNSEDLFGSISKITDSGSDII